MVKYTTALAVICYLGSADAFAPVGITRSMNSFKSPSASNDIAKTYQANKSTELGAVPKPPISSLSLPSLPSFNIAIDGTAVTQYFIETLISYGVPTFFTIVVIAFAAKSFKGAKGGPMGTGGPNGGLFGKNAVTEIYDDLYGTGEAANKSPFAMFSKGPNSNATPKNLGVPKDQYLKITKLNDKYQSFQYSLTAATQSKAKAAAQYRAAAFDSALTRGIDSSIEELSLAQKSDLLTEEKEFLKRGGDLLGSVTMLQRTITDLVIKEEMREMDVEIGEVDAYNEKNGVVDATIVDEKKDEKKEEKKKTSQKSKSNKKDISKIVKEIGKLNTDLLKTEMEFIRAVIEIFGPNRANAIRAALIGNIEGGGAGVAGGLISSLQDRPLSAILDTLGYNESGASKNLFVSDFPGDVSASQVETLREEVTAIIRASKPGDEVLLVLQSGGGTVTGYGLAAAQLKRFKQHGMKLTICVEQVAASGGYMMACVADRIVASPFAVLGSIGVISDLPNVYERLKREGIEFQTVTAGKYKRTLTPTKKVTDEDLKKSKEDIEEILKLFKAFVGGNRPSLDIDDVATGETWFGEDALNKGLCDELNTVDDVLTQYVDSGYNVYSVKYDPMTPVPGPLGALLPATESNKDRGIMGGIAKWVVRSIVPAMKEELASEFKSMDMGSKKVENQYMMTDPKESADRIRMEL